MNYLSSSKGTYPYSTLLCVVGAMAYLELGKQFHHPPAKLRFKFDIILNNYLIPTYGKCGDIDNACCMFTQMISRDVISWNSIIIGLFHHGLANEVLKVFETMQEMGMKPNSFTFLGVLSAYSHTGLIGQSWMRVVWFHYTRTLHLSGSPTLHFPDRSYRSSRESYKSKGVRFTVWTGACHLGSIARYMQP